MIVKGVHVENEWAAPPSLKRASRAVPSGDTFSAMTPSDRFGVTHSYIWGQYLKGADFPLHSVPNALF